MKRVISHLFCITCLLGCLCANASTATASLPKLPADATVLAFGDSLTAGIGGSGSSYPEILAQRIGRRVINAGNPGETTKGGRTRLATTLRRVQPDLLILCLGTNDFLFGVAAEQIRDNLSAMLNIAAKNHVPVLLLALARPGKRTSDPMFATIAAAGKACLADAAAIDVVDDILLKADLVHPNKAGYQQLAAAIQRRLQILGAL